MFLLLNHCLWNTLQYLMAKWVNSFSLWKNALVGGFNPSEKYWPNWIISPNSDEQKNVWNHHPVDSWKIWKIWKMILSPKNGWGRSLLNLGHKNHHLYSFGKTICFHPMLLLTNRLHPLKFNIAPEKWWLEDYFPIGKAYVQGLCETSKSLSTKRV